MKCDGGSGSVLTTFSDWASQPHTSWPQSCSVTKDSTWKFRGSFHSNSPSSSQFYTIPHLFGWIFCLFGSWQNLNSLGKLPTCLFFTFIWSRNWISKNLSLTIRIYPKALLLIFFCHFILRALCYLDKLISQRN